MYTFKREIRKRIRLGRFLRRNKEENNLENCDEQVIENYIKRRFRKSAENEYRGICFINIEHYGEKMYGIATDSKYRKSIPIRQSHLENFAKKYNAKIEYKDKCDVLNPRIEGYNYLKNDSDLIEGILVYF